MSWNIVIEYFIFFVIMKLLIKDYIVKPKEIFIVTLTSLFLGYVMQFVGMFIVWGFFLSLCYLLYQEKNYSVIKALALTSMTMVIANLLDHITSAVGNFIFIDYSHSLFWLYSFHMPFYIITSILFTYLLVIFTKDIRFKINQNEQLQTAVMSISLMILASFYGSIIVGKHLGNTMEIMQLNLAFFLIYVCLSLFIFYFYAKSLREKYEMQKSKDEHEYLERYIKEMETQYSEMRKFKHDYQNILTSLDSFVMEEDFEGLKNYYLEKIKKTSEIMNKQLFQLEGLSKIEVSEIKSILAMKLMRAQERGVDVIFEAVDSITSISLDSVVLVRTLGILLDNAIEEIVEMNNGKLLVGVFKSDNSTTFIVQNTCREDTPRVHKLKQLGFSTKGAGRGVGLYNVSEFVKAHENMSLETTIKGNQFIQKVVIGG